MADTQRDDLQADSSTAESSTEDTSTEDTSATAGGTPHGSAAEAGTTDVSSEPVLPVTSQPEAAQPAVPEPEIPVEPSSVPSAMAEPSLESSTSVSPLGGSATGGGAAASLGDSEGGEWALLVEKLQAWWSSGEFQKLWAQAKTPLTLVLGGIAVLLVLRVYAGLLGIINSLPLVSGLLELVGVIWTVRYGLPRLIRRSEREQLLAGLEQRWRSFSGRG